MDEAARDGLTRQQFARYYLTLAPPAIVIPEAQRSGRAGVKLGIGHDLTRIALDPKHPRKLASEAELLVPRPGLQHIE
jgi:hypothetical protein